MTCSSRLKHRLIALVRIGALEFDPQEPRSFPKKHQVAPRAEGGKRSALRGRASGCLFLSTWGAPKREGGFFGSPKSARHVASADLASDSQPRARHCDVAVLALRSSARNVDVRRRHQSFRRYAADATSRGAKNKFLRDVKVPQVFQARTRRLQLRYGASPLSKNDGAWVVQEPLRFEALSMIAMIARLGH